MPLPRPKPAIVVIGHEYRDAMVVELMKRYAADYEIVAPTTMPEVVEVLQGLGVVGCLGVAQRTAVGAQSAAQGLEVVTQVVRGLCLAHGQLQKRSQRGLLGHVAGRLDGVLELAAQGLR